MSELYRDFIDRKADQIITDLGGTITPAPSNAELYRDFLGRKFDDVITALNGSITPAPAGDELYRDFIERKFDDVIAGIGGYLPPITFPTLTGSIVTFNSQYAGLPLKSHTVDVVATQSGYSAINIGAVGDNVWDETTKQGYYHGNGGYYVNVSGQLCSNTFIEVQPNTTYRFCKPNTHGDVLFYDENGTYLNQYVSGVQKNGTFTTPSGCYKININLGNNYGATYNNDVIIAYPSGTYTTINIGQTVNEATYNARTGVMEVTHPSVQTIQLPPCPIDTLQGMNNIFADTGDTTLQYIKIGGNT